MVLCNLQRVNDNSIIDLRIKDGRISDIGYVKGVEEHEINFENAIVFPGLINSHDHLDFNLFPQLGNKRYGNYAEWGKDIHAQNKQIIDNVLKVPHHLRVRWGIYKNLINGITTVVNHGAKLDVDGDLITIFQQCHNLHSVQLEKGWRYKLNKLFIRRWPFVVHVGEGTDDNAHQEIDTLIKWNLLDRKIIGVHGIAMNERQADSFKALIWCPSSNYFLIGKTAPVDRLRNRTRIIFGTDSTLSAGWNIWEHLRLARSTNLVNDHELYDMVAKQPASIWKMKCTGELKQNYDADVVIARQKNNLQGYNAWHAIDPEDILMVIHKGDIKMFDATLLKQLTTDNGFLNGFSKIRSGNTIKYIYGDLPGLMAEIKKYYPEAIFPVNSEY